MSVRALMLLTLSALCLAARSTGQEVQFNRDIRPLLSDKCYFCHGPDEKERKADLRLDTREGATADLGGYAAIAPGKPSESALLSRITHRDPDEMMPPPRSKRGRLTADEVALIRRWIEQGAEYQGHWAFEPVAAPQTRNEPGDNPVDRLIDKRLQAEGITPSRQADRATLIRRVSLDLTGLLPTPEETAAFVDDKRPDAWERLVDRLLASPHYGERWGRHWLDQARYADSHGYSIDGDRDMWPYRDWVIKALNDDMPFDQFTIEQLAGDLLPNPSTTQLVATAFHRNTLINQEGGSDREQFRVESVVDRVNTTGAVWLGLTVSCAQCHTHKFDPITQREYYRLFAFFNNTEDANGTGPTVTVAEHEILGTPENEKEAFDDLESSISTQPPAWKTAKFVEHRTASGAALKALPDQSLLANKRAAPNDSFQLTLEAGLPEVAALRLRVLTDKSLPKNGPGLAGNGNFVLTNIEVTANGRPVTITRAFADHEQKGYPVADAIDRDKQSGWAINVHGGSKARMNSNHEAVFVFAKPADTANGALQVKLSHDRNENYLIGRFAIDLSATAPPAPARTKPASPKARSGKLMVMRELKKHRPTYILTRGDFTRPEKEAGELTPGVLEHVKPAFPVDGRTNRLDLAKWLVDPANPLTPRVTVNRIWMRYFGRGLVETEEDFGTQGTPPTHPELLDLLAHSLVENGWSMKKLHRLIVTSETYRRSSKARPDLNAKDARNLLLARQNRIRLDAEIIRDAALSASGLLAPTIGGPSVRPPQPDGIYAFTQNRKSWKTSSGGDRYRRAMYTFFYRSAPYPLFSTFDAPDFQTTCTRRVRSNTPLQALTMANDPAFLEFAQGLALRLLKEVPDSIDGRIQRASQLALSRDATEGELHILRTYGRQQYEDFSRDEKSARALLSDELLNSETPPAEAAALVGIARAIFNTDNFITRE